MSKKYLILTYGCQMNVHESEKLAGILERRGFSPCENATEADIVIFNTCAIRESAEQKIFGNIGELKNIKIAKPDMIVAVCGCMSQQKNYADIIMTRFPFVDIVFGTHNLADFDKLLSDFLKSKKRISSVVEDEKIALRDQIQMVRTSGVNAWVNIMYGCNNFCTYCIVPYVRGREVSRPEADILSEIKALLDSGFKQITLLGQNVNSYLSYCGEKTVDFATLLSDIDALDGEFRIRFMTSHPKDLSDKVIDVIAGSKHICHGIHLPLQSGSNKILSAMNRRYTKESYLELASKIKAKMPDAELTTDIIVGFPDETEEDFLQTLDVIAKVKFMQIFGFLYSKRKGTVAEKMDGQIDLNVKKERLSRLLAVKNEIISDMAEQMLGKTYDVLVESSMGGKLMGSLDSGKTISFEGSESAVGEFVKVRVSKVNKSVIFGELLSDTSNFKVKNFRCPLNVSILPKSEKNLKILRENKKQVKSINDFKSKKSTEK